MVLHFSAREKKIKEIAAEAEKNGKNNNSNKK
jgi:hypothetical protein